MTVRRGWGKGVGGRNGKGGNVAGKRGIEMVRDIKTATGNPINDRERKKQRGRVKTDVACGISRR
ncbi:MAG: hypothetical protein ACOXZ0_05295 [Eubacteriales bacterium]|jgi:hypothetical protein